MEFVTTSGVLCATHTRYLARLTVALNRRFPSKKFTTRAVKHKIYRHSSLVLDLILARKKLEAEVDQMCVALLEKNKRAPARVLVPVLRKDLQQSAHPLAQRVSRWLEKRLGAMKKRLQLPKADRSYTKPKTFMSAISNERTTVSAKKQLRHSMAFLTLTQLRAVEKYLETMEETAIRISSLVARLGDQLDKLKMYGIDVALMHSLGVTNTNRDKGEVIQVSIAKRTVLIAIEKATANADQVNLCHP